MANRVRKNAGDIQAPTKLRKNPVYAAKHDQKGGKEGEGGETQSAAWAKQEKAQPRVYCAYDFSNGHFGSNTAVLVLADTKS